MNELTDKALIKIAETIIDKVNNDGNLTVHEKIILNILRDERILKKNLDTGMCSLMPTRPPISLFRSSINPLPTLTHDAPNPIKKSVPICGGVHDENDGSFGRIR